MHGARGSALEELCNQWMQLYISGRSGAESVGAIRGPGVRYMSICPVSGWHDGSKITSSDVAQHQYPKVNFV